MSFHLLPLVPLLPLAGFLWLALGAGRLTRRSAARIGVSSVAIAALLVIAIGTRFLVEPPDAGAHVQTLGAWLRVAGFQADFAFRLDPLSLVLSFVVTFVGFWIHLYSAFYMAEDEAIARFFAYMNLFVAAMLILVLADDLLLLYLGWEGVGLCSYLLIGFWYRDPANGYAARKAFVMTRVGDTAFLIGLLLLFSQLGSTRITELMERATAMWASEPTLASVAALLLLAGAVGKSAQLPLQTWLPDAMAGPTPVSALIHAATMVTAGVYLIARTHVLFELAPAVQNLVAVIGALTLLLAGFSAVVQTDIKRILAYSTMSQIGYMFLALGVGAWSAAIFHLFTHAFFKALLFLSAGVVIVALHHEQNIFRMGDLRRRLPAAFWSFLVGAAALAALPLVTAGFYSKDLILWQAYAAENGSLWFWLAGWVGAFVTALYIFRLFFIAFTGEPKTPIRRTPEWTALAPLWALGILSLVAGFVEMPATLGGVTLFRALLEPVLPLPDVHAPLTVEAMFQLLSMAASLAGIALAWLLYRHRPVMAPTSGGITEYWREGWGFDLAYERLVVHPTVCTAHWARHDLFERPYDRLAGLARSLHRGLATTQNGRVRWYAGGIAAGSAVAFALVLLA